ncbi:MAG: sensor histidine kinase [Gemmatimonadaceae bacterium]
MSIKSLMRAYGARPFLLGAALLGVVIVSGLAVRDSMRNAQERRVSAERTVRDYAKFAAYLYATRGYLAGRERAMLAYVAIHPGEPWTSRSALPPVTALASIPDTTEMCGPRASWPIYRYRVDVPSGAVSYAGPLPPPEIQGIIRDSIPKLANRSWDKLIGFGYLFVGSAGGQRETIAYSPAIDSASHLLAVYGYRSCYGVRDTLDYTNIYKVVKVLPPMTPGYSDDVSSTPSATAQQDPEKLSGKWPMGVPPESLLTLTVRDRANRVIYKAPKTGPASNFYARSPLVLGPTVFEVALRPDVARYLVVGGIPESHVPASMLFLAGSIVLAIAGFASLRSEIRLVRSRERFLANVSHELRTPLQQILLFVQLLRLGRTRSETERERSLEIIERETHRLIALSNSVLTAAKPEMQLKSTAVDVARVAQTAADFFAPLAEARKMRIELDLAERAMARGDPGAIRQILINVLDNAAKYGPVGQTIVVGVRDEGKLVRLWVDDSGPGITEAEREKVWEPFFRVGGTLDDSTGGAGLGLAIVRDLATAMDAEAALTPRPAGGTRFTLALHASTNGTHA